MIEQNGREVGWINRFLDQQRVRGVADATLRSYGHDLLHFLRWWAAAHQTAAITKEALSESTLLDYIRWQVGQQALSRQAGVMLIKCRPTHIAVTDFGRDHFPMRVVVL